MLHALTGGNGYSEIQRLGRGRPHALHLLDPGSTEPEETAARLVYHLRDVGRTLPHTSVLHVAGLSLDGLVGLNFVRLLRQAIGLDRAAETSAANYFANGSEPGGVIETPQKLNPEAKLRLRDGWEGRHGGPGGRHRVAVLEQGASWKATGTDPDKSQLLETRKHQVLDVIRAWRVPPHKAGDLSQAHLANLEASNLDYLMTALVGWLEAIEQEFNLKLFSRSERAAGLYCEHDVNALLRGDIKSRMAAYSTGLRDGWTNRNEVRRRENLNPIPAEEGGDTYTVQAQMIPLRDVGKDRTIPAQAPQSEPNPAEGV